MAGKKFLVAGDLYFEIDGKLQEIKRQLRQPGGYPFDPRLLNDALQGVIEGKFVSSAGKLIVPAEEKVIAPRRLARTKAEIGKLLALYPKFYKKLFGLEVSLKGVRVPESPDPEFVWPIFAPQGLTPNKVVAAMRKAGIEVWCHNEDLDRIVTENIRDPQNGSYIVLVRNRIEADEELKNLSANQTREQGLNCVTLLERLVLGFFHWSRTGGKKGGVHLDQQTITRCDSSRSAGGCVPSVYWYPGRRGVGVGWYIPGNANPGIRSRVTVS